MLKACENRRSLDEEFSQIPVITVKPEELPAGAEVKNRYANVIPLPETRICLSSTNKCSDSVADYINANYVKVKYTNRLQYVQRFENIEKITNLIFGI